MTDAELLSRLREDQAAGVEALLQRYAPLLQYVIGGVLRDPQDAEDCYSEVTLTLWQKLNSYEETKGSLSGWLTTVARNTALNHWKARQRRDAHLSESETEPASPSTPESELLRRERAERLQTVIQRLSPQEKQLFYRKYYYMQPVSQIAAEMGLTERAAEGRLYRLRKRLQTELGGDSI